MGVRADITGQRFGRLIARAPHGTNPDGKLRWSCECDCGSIKVVDGRELRRDATRSCGCYRRERMAVIGATDWRPRPA